MPFWPHLLQGSKMAGKILTTALEQKSGPLYVVGSSTEHNMLVYVRGPIRAVTLDDLAALNTSAIAVLLPEEERVLAQKKPGLRLVGVTDIVSQKTPYRVVEIIQP